MKNLSIIIPIYRGEKTLKDTFASLEKVKIGRGLKLAQIIFVDDGSPDRTFETLSNLSGESSLPVSFVSYKNKLGHKKAGAVGLKYSTSKLNIIVKSDLSDLDTKLSRLQKRLEKEKENRPPTLSVVMPVYNAAPFLKQSINSILKQTFKDFEFIIIDDASTDNSWEIVQKFAKKYPNKIRAFQNERNVKQAKTVNRAIKMARGDFIARMDADDVSLPNRFEKQIEYLRTHPKTVAVGAQCLIIDAKGKITGEKKFPTAFDDVYSYIFKFCPAQQPTFMIARKRLPHNLEYYDHDLSPVEDVEFLFKLFKYGRVENLPDYLLLYRIHGNNSSLKNYRRSFFLTLLSRVRGVVFHEYKPSPVGIAYTLAQTVAVSLLPQELNTKIYKFIKEEAEKSTSQERSYRRLAYQFSKSL
ncbi:MAG TPA: glycosyltransferase [Patescibacteria group bacterium]|nr:glycosyltransferase [Patescibacteria group bacterium]